MDEIGVTSDYLNAYVVAFSRKKEKEWFCNRHYFFRGKLMIKDIKHFLDSEVDIKALYIYGGRMASLCSCRLI